MEQNQPETPGVNLYNQWTQEQQIRVSAALDLYLHYLLKNFELRDLPEATAPSEEQEVLRTILRTVRSRKAQPHVAAVERLPPDTAIP
jgi:hypothetical protein